MASESDVLRRLITRDDGDPEIGEGILPAFLPRLLRRGGWKFDGHILRIDRLNNTDIFAPDYGLELDGDYIGVIDPETKGPDQDPLFMPNCNWPISVPRWTMKYHSGATNAQRETNKVAAFRRWPAGSFWVGLRADYRRAIFIHAPDILGAPIIERQRGNFPRPLTLFNVARSAALFADIATVDAEDWIVLKLRNEGLLND